MAVCSTSFFCFLIILTRNLHLVISDKIISSPGVKAWSVNINYGNRNNWAEQKLPCNRNRIIFPSSSKAYIFIDTDIIGRELVLPFNGDLILGNRIKLQLSSTSQDKDCTEKDVKFLVPSPGSWYSPNSWNAGLTTSTQASLPIPETERIPCFYDQAVFPQQSSFLVKINGPPISVSIITLAGQNVTSQKFEELTETIDGRKQFSKSTSVNIHSSRCSDITGCKCGNDQPQVKDVICNLYSCPIMDCTDPIRPEGSCCSVCGSMLILTYGQDFEFDKIKKLYSIFMKKPEYDTVRGYLSKTSSNKIQAIFTDSQETHHTMALASEIQQYLLKDISEVSSYGVRSVRMESSHTWISYSKHTMARGLSIGSLMGVVFAFICILIIASAIFILYKKYCGSSVPFWRFADESRMGFNRTSQIEMDNPMLTEFEDESLKDLPKGYDNPMFEGPPPPKPPRFEDSTFASSTYSNPLFETDGEEIQDLQEDLLK